MTGNFIDEAEANLIGDLKELVLGHACCWIYNYITYRPDRYYLLTYLHTTHRYNDIIVVHH